MKKTKIAIILGITLILGNLFIFSSAAQVSENSVKPETPITDPNVIGSELKKIMESPQDESDASISKTVKNPVLSLRIESFDIGEDNYRAGDEVKGSLKLKNSTNFYSDGNYYQIDLIKKEEEKLDQDKVSLGYYGSLNRYDFYRSSDVINFSPREEKAIDFSYKIPKNIPQGQYLLVFTVLSARESNLISELKDISIENSSFGNFIFLNGDKTEVYAKNMIYRFQGGPTFNYDEEYIPFSTNTALKNEVKVKIPFQKEMANFGNLTGKINIYRYGKPLEEVDYKEVTFSSDQFKDNEGIIELLLPLQKEPGSYEAFVQVFSDGKSISNPLGIRYVTSGDSSVIYNYLVEERNDKDYILHLMITAPASFTERNRNIESKAEIKFSVKEKDGQKFCYSQKKEVYLSNSVLNVPFQLTDCQKPFIFSAGIFKDGKTLDLLQTTVEKEKNEITMPKEWNYKKIISVVFAVFTAVIILLIVIYFKKKNNSRFIPLILFFLFSGFLFFNSGKAQASREIGLLNNPNMSYFTFNDGYDDDGDPNRYLVTTYAQIGIGGGECLQWTCPANTEPYTYYYDWWSETRCCPSNLYQCYWDWGWGNSCSCRPENEWSSVPVINQYCVNANPTYPIYGYYRTPIDIRVPYSQNVNRAVYQHLWIQEYIQSLPNCGNGNPSGGPVYTDLVAYDAGGNVIRNYGRIRSGMHEEPGNYYDAYPYVGDFPDGSYTMAYTNYKWFYEGEDDPYFMYMTVYIPFTVYSPDTARYISQSVPTTINTSQTVPVSITLQNCRSNGDCSNLNTWLRQTSIGDSYRLITGSGWADPGQDVWGVNNIQLSNDVPAGGTHTFNFNITAPSIPGTYHFRWRMLHGGVAPFGDMTPDTIINVACVPNCDCSLGNCFDSSCSDGCGGSCSGQLQSASGQCGSTNDKILPGKPKTDLCNLGLASEPRLVDNKWYWNCSGICGGGSTECYAQRDINWKEVKP